MQNTYHNQTAKFPAAIAQSMPEVPSNTMQKRIQNPRELSRVLAKALSSFVEPVEFPIWKVIKLGTYKSIEDIRESFKKKGIHITDGAEYMLSKIPLAKIETKVTLHIRTVKELTGKNSATKKEIYKAICAKGYGLCPAELGPLLRLQYLDQPFDEWINIAMEPVHGRRGNPCAFDLNSGGAGLGLGGSGAQSDGRWPSDDQFVFLASTLNSDIQS